jgi:ABC-2 type transport system ATP-binding protein
MRSMPPVIHIEKLTKVYGHLTAVDGLTLKVQRGEVFGLLGPNGAGKSTTLYMLTGMVRPTGGSVSIFGKDLRKHFLEIAGRIGVMFDRPAFFDYLSVRRNLLILSQLARRSVTIDRALDMVGLLDSASKPVATLSLGMRQRLALAQALLLDPDLLILDEPTTGLDAEATQDVLALLRRLAVDAKVTILLSSHMLHDVEALCDRVAVMNHGRLLACDKTENLLAYDESIVEVVTDTGDAAAKRLRQEEWVAAVEVKPGRLVVRLRTGSAHHLNSYLVGAGYRVSALLPRRRTLHEYFLDVLKS